MLGALVNSCPCKLVVSLIKLDPVLSSAARMKLSSINSCHRTSQPCLSSSKENFSSRGPFSVRSFRSRSNIGVSSRQNWLQGFFLSPRRKLKVQTSLVENVPIPQRDERNNNSLASLDILLESTAPTSTSTVSPLQSPVVSTPRNIERIEAFIERTIFDFRFFTLLAVVGSLAGSVLCFFSGSAFIAESFREYFCACWCGLGTGKVILYLVEAVDVYLMGTVMLIFGMGLYELFVSSLEVPGGASGGIPRTAVCGSNLFGLFRLRVRPKWLEIRSLDQLKTKLGHVIVMILLVGMFEKSKKVPISSGLDLLFFSASILLASTCLFLLNKLHEP